MDCNTALPSGRNTLYKEPSSSSSSSSSSVERRAPTEEERDFLHEEVWEEPEEDWPEEEPEEESEEEPEEEEKPPLKRPRLNSADVAQSVPPAGTQKSVDVRRLLRGALEGVLDTDPSTFGLPVASLGLLDAVRKFEALVLPFYPPGEKAKNNAPFTEFRSVNFKPFFQGLNRKRSPTEAPTETEVLNDYTPQLLGLIRVFFVVANGGKTMSRVVTSFFLGSGDDKMPHPFVRVLYDLVFALLQRVAADSTADDDDGSGSILFYPAPPRLVVVALHYLTQRFACNYFARGNIFLRSFINANKPSTTIGHALSVYGSKSVSQAVPRSLFVLTTMRAQFLGLATIHPGMVDFSEGVRRSILRDMVGEADAERFNGLFDDLARYGAGDLENTEALRHLRMVSARIQPEKAAALLKTTTRLCCLIKSSTVGGWMGLSCRVATSDKNKSPINAFLDFGNSGSITAEFVNNNFAFFLRALNRLVVFYAAQRLNVFAKFVFLTTSVIRMQSFADIDVVMPATGDSFDDVDEDFSVMKPGHVLAKIRKFMLSAAYDWAKFPRILSPDEMARESAPYQPAQKHPKQSFSRTRDYRVWIGDTRVAAPESVDRGILNHQYGLFKIEKAISFYWVFLTSRKDDFDFEVMRDWYLDAIAAIFGFAVSTPVRLGNRR